MQENNQIEECSEPITAYEEERRRTIADNERRLRELLGPQYLLM